MCQSRINYQNELDKVIASIKDNEVKPRLLLHSCCAPCSSYCLVYLRQWFDITCYYYNPNITEQDEYYKRVGELVRLVDALSNDPVGISKDDNGGYRLANMDAGYLDLCGRLDVIKGDYDSALFHTLVREGNLANEPEGGKRCEMCFSLRLQDAFRVAVEEEYDYYTTSLTISPLKNAQLLNAIGASVAAGQEKVLWLPSDFKKRNGYKLSTLLCARYDLYRQNYCGCVYSKQSVD